MSTFTLIVPVFQTPEILRLFLDSLKQTLSQNSDIIFVNDGSGYTVQRMLQSFQQELCHHSFQIHVTILEHQVSQGSVASINEAICHVNGHCEYVTFLDSDTILQAHWQEQLISSFTEDDIGAVGGVLLYPQSGGIQCCGITYCGNSGKHLYLNSNPDILNDVAPFEVQATVFAFCCIRWEVMKRIGFLDECYFNGYEDLDYQFRLRKLGYRILINPSIRHYHWEKSNGNHREYNRKSNLGRFWQKHGTYVKDDLFCFIQNRFEGLLPLSESYNAVDCCEGRDAAAKVKAWLNEYENIHISNWTDTSYACHNGDTIWLPELFDSGKIQDSQPILFLCDQMVQMLDNQYWWSIRKQINQHDLVLDLYGNVLFFSQLQHGFWPGRKIR